MPKTKSKCELDVATDRRLGAQEALDAQHAVRRRAVQDLSDADDARRAVIGDACLGKPEAVAALDQANTAKAAAVRAIEDVDVGIAHATTQLDEARAVEVSAQNAANALRFKDIARRRIVAAAKLEAAFGAVMTAIDDYDHLGAELLETGLVNWAVHHEINDRGRLVFVIPEQLQRIICANGAPIHPQAGITFAQREAMIWGLPPLDDAQIGKAA